MDNQTNQNNQPNQDIQVPQEIRAYLESVLEDAGMKPLDDDMREEMIRELFVRLDSFLLSTVINNIPEAELESFTKLNEENRPKEEIEKFVTEKIPNVQEVMAKAFGDFRELYLGNVAAARNAPKQS